MTPFNVIKEDNGKFVPYDIMPYLYERYKKSKPKPKTYENLKAWIKNESARQWWSRCEYEIIISDWPPSGKEEKWDIYKQIMMNLDNIVILFMEKL